MTSLITFASLSLLLLSQGNLALAKTEATTATTRETEVETQTSSGITESSAELTISSTPNIAESKIDLAMIFDYTMLDDPGDRDGFTSENINKPVKLWSDAYRGYYGFFGGIAKGDTSTNFLTNQKINHLGSTIGKPLNADAVSFLNPAIIAVPNDTKQLPISYSYYYDTSFENISPGNTGFDMAELNTENQLMYTAAQAWKSNNNSDGFKNSEVAEILISEDERTMYVYGKQVLTFIDIKNTTAREYYVRTKITVLENEHARFTFRVYNPYAEDKRMAVSYGTHMDIAGQHIKSKMYTMGNDDGIYFNEGKLHDGYPYLLNFHRTGYLGEANSPTSIIFNDAGDYSLSRAVVKNELEQPLPVEPIPDLEKDAQLPYLKHPGFVFQYDPVILEPNTFMDFDMEISIYTKDISVKEAPITVTYVDQAGKELAPPKTYDVEVGQTYSENAATIPGYVLVSDKTISGTVENQDPINIKFVYEKEIIYQGVKVKYLDESGKAIAGQAEKNYQLEVGKTYTEVAPEILGYKLDKTEGETTGTIVEGQDVTIVFNYKEDRFAISQAVEMLNNGSSAAQVNLGDELLYTVKLASNLVAVDPAVNYQTFTIKEPIDANLTDIKNLTLKTTSGKTVGQVSYDQTNQEVVAKITGADGVSRSEGFILTYTAKVKEDTAFGTVIKEKASAYGEYSDGMKAKEQFSNEVQSVVAAGELLFISAPKTLDFGKKVAISAQDEIYPLNVKEDDLTVKDLRGNGSRWSLSATMLSEMTNEKGSLGNSLYYRYNGVEQLIKVGTSAKIYETTTKNANSIVISDEWETTENKPFMKVKAGEAKLGKYEGVIQWSIQDVPNP